MKTVFSTANIEKTKRFSAWQEALCEHYLKVNTHTQASADYEGFLNKSTLGSTVLSEVFLSAQDIVRDRRHIAQLDKDCFYIMYPSRGSLLVEQAGKQRVSAPGTAVLFDATVPYHLKCGDYLQSMYVEVPRSVLVDRCSIDTLESVPAFNFADGLGWAVAEFCKLLAFEADAMGDGIAQKAATEAADLLALCIEAESTRRNASGNIAHKFRLQSLKSYIENRLDDPDLSPALIARDNRISVRYLHYLFKETGVSVSEWVREQRLTRGHQRLTSQKFINDSITDIALDLGFNSSSHFTRLFKAKFGMPPRDARRQAKKAILKG